MAVFTTNVDMQGFNLDKLLESEFGDIAKDVLTEATPKLRDSVKKACGSVIKNNTGQLVNSIKAYKPKYSPGHDCWVGGVSFYGHPTKVSKRSDGKTTKRRVSNRDIAFWLENGNSHQTGKPFIQKASNDAESAILDIAQKVFNQKTGAK